MEQLAINKVRGFRTMTGLSQEAIAKELGISVVSYRLKETGQREFTQSEMVKFVKLVQELEPTITMDDIFMVELKG